MSLTNASEITQTVTPAEGQPGATGRQPGTNEVLESQPGLSFSQPGSSLSQPGSSQCQPGILYPPDLNLGETLSGINSNMSSMATLLRKVVEHGGLLDNKKPSRTAQKRRTESPDLSGSSESEDDADSHPVREKRPRREDELSVGVPSDDDDLKELLTGEDGAENPEVAIAPTEEVEILKSLEADFDDDEPVGQKIQHNLANIASKRWEVSLSNDKLKGLLARHVKPENCADLTVPKVNPEIWSQLDNFKRKADLRLGNIQQALQKATFGILKSCDSQVSNHSSVNKDALEPAIDAIALMGHAVSELSRLRREQVKPALKREFYSLCTAANESSARSPLLFGTDLAKQIRDAKDASNIGQKIGAGGKNGAQRTSRNHYPRHGDKKRSQKGYNYPDYRPPFLGKSQKKPTYKKHQPNKK
ncbi:uncharacterized protein LOC144666894 [Oculina patagonica]